MTPSPVVWRGDLLPAAALFAAASATYSVEAQMQTRDGIPPTSALLIWQRDQLARRYPVRLRYDVPEGCNVGDVLFVDDDKRLRARKAIT